MRSSVGFQIAIEAACLREMQELLLGSQAQIHSGEIPMQLIQFLMIPSALALFVMGAAKLIQIVRREW